MPNEMFLTKKGLAKILSDYEEIKDPGKVREFINRKFNEFKKAQDFSKLNALDEEQKASLL